MSLKEMQRIRRKLLTAYRVLGDVIIDTGIVVTDKVRTIGLNSDDIMCNDHYFESLSEEERLFVFAHEYYHQYLHHMQRRAGKDIVVWDVATDVAVNAQLVRDGLQPPPNAILLPEVGDKDSVEIYNMLLNKQLYFDYDNADLKGGYIGHATHRFWNIGFQRKFSAEDLLTEDELTEEELEMFGDPEEINDALINQILQAGDTTHSDIREVKSIGRGKAIIDWRTALKEAINVKHDWTYEDAEVEDGILRAHLIEYPQPEAEIVLDTSGSVDEELLKNFLRECKNIMKSSRVKVGCFDTEFYGFHDVANEEDIDDLEYTGGGGTDFEVAVGAFTKRVENKILFTDGEAAMPEKPMDVIWVVFGDTEIDPRGGRVIYLTSEEVKTLTYFYDS